MDWYQVKLVIVELTNVSRDALHVIGGVIIQFAAAALFRRGLAHPLPLLSVLALALANELFDLTLESWWHRPMWPGSLHDVAVTMLIPVMLLLLARYAPRIFSR